MKKGTTLFFMLAFVLSSLLAAAQGTEVKEKTKAKGDMAEKSHLAGTTVRDGIMMQGGKMMVMRTGKPTLLNEDMKLTNGTTVMRDGTLRMADGSTRKMQNGDRIDLDGTMSHDHAGHAGTMQEQKPGNAARTKIKQKEDKMKIKDGKNESKVEYDE